MSPDDDNSDKNDSSTAPEPTEQPTEDEKPKKYVFECTKCGLCCEKRSHIPLTLQDIELWMKKGTLPTVLPYIEMGMIGMGEPDKAIPTLLLTAAQTDEEVIKQQPCPMYDKDNKICNIYFAMPSDCDTFPWAYNGKKYTVIDKSCEGFGLTPDQFGQVKLNLKKAQAEKAKADFEAKIQTNLVLPIIYNTFMKSMLRQQQKMMETLSPDQKEKLDEILKKDQPEEGNTPPS